MVAKKVQAFAHVAPEALQLSFRGKNISTQLLGTKNHVTALSHREITAERDHVGRDIDEQHTAETDVVIHESHESPSNKPSALHASQQESIGLHELAFRREFLDQRGDGRPKHPKSRRNQ